MTLDCTVCGQEAPSKKQWWNQDKGYGICLRCWRDAVRREGEARARWSYGVPGVHHEPGIQQSYGLEDLRPGALVLIQSLAFGVVNVVRYLHGDETGLGRDIGYFKFLRQYDRTEFAHWDFDFSSGRYRILSVANCEKKE